MLKSFAIYRIKINIFGTAKRNKEAVSKRQYTVQLYWLSKDRRVKSQVLRSFFPSKLHFYQLKNTNKVIRLATYMFSLVSAASAINT